MIGIISTQDNLQKEVDHLARVLKQNGYPANFIRDASALSTQETADISSPEEGQEKGLLVMIPYVAELSEDIRRVCRNSLLDDGSHLTAPHQTIPSTQPYILFIPLKSNRNEWKKFSSTCRDGIPKSNQTR